MKKCKNATGAVTADASHMGGTSYAVTKAGKPGSISVTAAEPDAMCGVYYDSIETALSAASIDAAGKSWATAAPDISMIN